MNRMKNDNGANTGKLELESVLEDMEDFKHRMGENASVYHMLNETMAESSTRQKLKEMKKFMADAAKMAERAEKILAEVIRERENENREIEDAILLRDGTTKVNGKKNGNG